MTVPGSRARGQNLEGLRPRDKGRRKTDKLQSSDWENYSDRIQKMEGRWACLRGSQLHMPHQPTVQTTVHGGETASDPKGLGDIC